MTFYLYPWEQKLLKFEPKYENLCQGNIFQLIEAGWPIHTIISSDNVLWPDRRQAIIWTNAKLLLTWPLRANICDILTKKYNFDYRN